MVAPQSLDTASCWKAVIDRDRASDGRFVYAVSTTGIYCRPTCPSRRPRRRNVRFFLDHESAERAGFRACARCKPKAKAEPRVDLSVRVCRFLEQRREDAPALEDLSQAFGLSAAHLQRTFKTVVGISPKEYLESIRREKLTNGLKSGKNVTEAIYEAGYGSPSRVYEAVGALQGMTPASYGRGGKGAVIRYALADSPLGRLLVASTDKGVCAIRFGAADAELISRLREEFHAADIHPDDGALQPVLTQALNRVNALPLPFTLPLDIRATAFQRRVWAHLRKIPIGGTESYGEVAEALGEPTAARAVARACAANPLAAVVPCHRVVRGDGSAGGYRWGVERKKKLLEREQRGLTSRRPAVDPRPWGPRNRPPAQPELRSTGGYTIDTHGGTE